MTRWKPKVTKDTVLAYQKMYPEKKSTEMAKALNCSPSYIRATLGRAGIRLHRSKLLVASLCGINRPVSGIKKRKRKHRD